ncbi:amino acid ABC transporter permease [Occultella gossypii]|uniref:Amino acid ABC transporter permease n=1 Tax=Occultella gossypii TaxID=2800820 RepID=A0ABS7SIR8_9MICO|nr:amino acid ABC transporter permease [Occultella gossypii]MBZ2199211.1 amino acid ABC transporter permease [Occultella gossypii]
MSRQTVLFDAPGPRARRNVRVGNWIGAVVVIGIAVFVMVQLNAAGQLRPELWAVVVDPDSWRYNFLPGLQNTLVAAAYSIVTAVVFGLLFGVGRLASNRALRWFCGVVVEFFRAVPVLVMMVAGYQILGRFTAVSGTAQLLLGVVIALTLYNGAVIAELVRSGVYGLPKGQREAGLAIGMTRGQSIRSIELPQALIAMLPSLVSQFVVILKDTALGYIIVYPELLRSARLLGSGAPFAILQSLFVAALIFIVLNYLLSKVAELVARKVGGRTSGKARANPAPPNAVTVPAVGGSGT